MREKIKHLVIDPNRRIRSLKIGKSLCDSFAAVKLFDLEYKMFLDENWWDMRGYNPHTETVTDGVYDDNIESWTTLTIPKG